MDVFFLLFLFRIGTRSVHTVSFNWLFRQKCAYILNAWVHRRRTRHRRKNQRQCQIGAVKEYTGWCGKTGNFNRNIGHFLVRVLVGRWKVRGAQYLACFGKPLNQFTSGSKSSYTRPMTPLWVHDVGTGMLAAREFWTTPKNWTSLRFVFF